MTKDICIVFHNYFPKDPRVLKQSTTLVRKGYKVDILCLKDSREKKRESINGIDVIRIPLGKKRGSKIRYFMEFLLGFILFWSKLNSLFFRRRYKIIQICNIPNFYVYTAIFAKLFGARIILDMHEIMPELFLQRYNLDCRSLFYKLLLFEEKMAVRISNHIITVTDSMAEAIKKRNKINNVTVVMNTSCEIMKTMPKISKDGARRLRMIFHGTLTNAYRLETVIKVVENLIQKNLDISFSIFGDGNKFGDLKRLVRSKNLHNNIDLKGFLPFHKIIDVSSEYDLAVVPLDDNIYSKYAFSTKISEYISLRIPVICSDVSCMRNYFSDEAIIYFNVNNEEHLAKKIEYFMRCRKAEKTRLISEAIVQNNKINWQTMSERYVNLLEGHLN